MKIATVAPLLLVLGCNATVTSRPTIAAHPPAEPEIPRTKSPDDRFMALSDDILLERGAPAELQAHVLADYEKARIDLATVFGSIESQAPKAVVCESDPCKLYVAGPPRRSWALGPHQSLPGAKFVSGDRATIVIVRSDGGESGHMLHEMIHLEAHQRLGGKAVPTWFHEGLAFSFANREECKAPLPSGIDDLRRLDGNAAWAEFTNGHLDKMRNVYCQAFREVDAWRTKNGPDAPRSLLEAVRRGESFYDVYGSMLTQTSAPRSPEDSTYDRRVLVHGALLDSVTLDGSPDSFVTQEGFTDLARSDKPFTIALFVRPEENAGELVHVSSKPDGTGWCAPFIGFDEQGRLVGQVFDGRGAARSGFAITDATDAPTVGRWVHVALTWAPHGRQRLYVDGTRVSDIAALDYRSENGVVFVTWGSPGKNGAGTCATGAVHGSSFRGSIGGMRVLTKELSGAEVGDLARAVPGR